MAAPVATVASRTRRASVDRAQRQPQHPAADRRCSIGIDRAAHANARWRRGRSLRAAVPMPLPQLDTNPAASRRGARRARRADARGRPGGASAGGTLHPTRSLNEQIGASMPSRIAQCVLDQDVPSPRFVCGRMITAILGAVRLCGSLPQAALLIDRHASDANSPACRRPAGERKPGRRLTRLHGLNAGIAGRSRTL